MCAVHDYIDYMMIAQMHVYNNDHDANVITPPAPHVRHADDASDGVKEDAPHKYALCALYTMMWQMYVTIILTRTLYYPTHPAHVRDADDAVAEDASHECTLCVPHMMMLQTHVTMITTPTL